MASDNEANPMTPRDADPLDVTPRSLASQTHGYRPASRHVYRAALLAVGVALVLAGMAVGRATATPRTAPSDSGPWTLLEAPLDPDVAQSAERRVPDLRYAEATGSSPVVGANGGASLPPSAPVLTVPEDVEPTTSAAAKSGAISTGLVVGVASFVGPSYGSRYLALPEGPGVTVTICAKSICVTRTSNDAGPDLAMQRAGRVADLSWADFKRLCLCNPYVVGLLRVTVDYGGPSVTPPATDR